MRLDEAQKIMDRLNLVYDEGKRLAEQYATAEAALAERMSILRAARDRRFIDDAVLAKASIDAQREAIDRQVEQLRRYGTALDGVRAAILRYRADAQNASEVAADFTATALEGVERGLAGLVGMVARAETSWDALGKAATSALGTIAEEVARLAIRTQIIAPLFNALFGGQAIFGGAGAEIAAGAGVGGDRLAKGGVIDHGAIKRFATGGVVQRPTLFPMRGGVGLMGEAGPEAVLPLRRNARGELGVQAPPAATVVQIIDQRRGDAPEIEVRRQRGPGGEMLIEAYVREAVGREIARGALRAPMRQEFGLRPALHPRG
jgi:lambda family phage tail tape measure protein